MDGFEWAVSLDPRAMLTAARRRAYRDRKLVLFACACGRLAWSALPVELQQQIRFAEERPTVYAKQSPRARAFVTFDERFSTYSRDFACRVSVQDLAYSAIATQFVVGFDQVRAEQVRKALLLRDILGNPWLPPPTIPFVPPTVRALAESVYGQNAAAVGPLHDAILDAGLTDLAAHFQDPAEWHPKGCWAIDLLTGRC